MNSWQASGEAHLPKRLTTRDDVAVADSLTRSGGGPSVGRLRPAANSLLIRNFVENTLSLIRTGPETVSDSGAARWCPGGQGEHSWT